MTTTTPKNALAVRVQQIDAMTNQFSAALPAHVPVERFKRTVVQALQQNPLLIEADMRSLGLAAQKLAIAGLTPDGREAALVPFKIRKGPRAGKVDVQAMPMVQGLLKLARNTGEVQTLIVGVVHKGDHFRWLRGDDEMVEHVPAPLDADPGPMIGAYAICKTKSGGVYRAVLRASEIAKIRAVSRASDDGPWATWPDQMWVKSAIRRLSKLMPMATDRGDDGARRMAAAIEADDEQMIDVTPPANAGETSTAPARPKRPAESGEQSAGDDEGQPAAAPPGADDERGADDGGDHVTGEQEPGDDGGTPSPAASSAGSGRPLSPEEWLADRKADLQEIATTEELAQFDSEHRPAASGFGGTIGRDFGRALLARSKEIAALGEKAAP